jgi:hypothetical protein
LARIRIIDEWLRSPVASPSRYRAVMVVAESWSEQRVLMRAFAASGDQTRPTIVLYGVELAIGPAGLAAHGEWGIHVEPPVDGRAQELRNELELAARRLAGTKGNPPRLADEASRFENKATHLWAPGTAPDVPAGPAPATRAGYGYYEPAEVVARTARPIMVENSRAQSAFAMSAFAPPDRPTVLAARDDRLAEAAERRSRSATLTDVALFAGAAASPVASHTATTSTSALSVGSRTRPGYMPAPPPPPRSADHAVPRAPASASTHMSFASLVGRTMPLGLQLTQSEREVLNALGRAPALTADEIGRIVGASDPVPWMERFQTKLSELGLDLVASGTARTGEPTYVLRR